MDTDRFDTLARSLMDARSRRGALAALLGGTLGLLGLADTAAKKKRKKKGKKGKRKRKKKGCPAGTVACEGACEECCENTDCCDGGICENDDPVCSSFHGLTCVCQDNRPPCGGRCCLGGETCFNVGGIETCSMPAPSDRNLKANVASIDPADMLGRVRELPIATWNYTSDDPAIRHIGPMAQDFAALFGVGADDRHIHPIDGQGVALAAIQGLLGELVQVRAENARLAARITALEDEK